MEKQVEKAQEQPSREVVRAASAAGLGAHTATWWRGANSWRYTLMLLMMIGGSALTIWPFVDGGNVDWPMVVAWLVPSLALFAFVGVAVVRKLADPRERQMVHVFGFADGLVRRDGRGEIETLRWDEIAHVNRTRGRAPSGDTAYTYTITPRTGRTWSVFPREFRSTFPQTLGEYVEERLTAR